MGEKLPEVSPIQYLVIHALFTGEKSASEVRRIVEAALGRMSRTAFSRLMVGLSRNDLVHATYRVETSSGQTVRRRRYAVTDYGVILWNRTRKFYARRNPPPPGLVPVPSEAAQWRLGDKRTQDRHFARLLTEKLMRLAEAKLKRKR